MGVDNTYNQLEVLGKFMVKIDVTGDVGKTDELYIVEGMIFSIIIGKSYLRKYGLFAYNYDRKAQYSYGGKKLV